MRCYHHFDHSYQVEDPRVATAANTSYTVDSNWYVDSGATDHLTSDLDCLIVKGRYKGNDQVQVANGASLSISHIGHSCIAGSSSPLFFKNILHVTNISKNLCQFISLLLTTKHYSSFILISFGLRIKLRRKQ